MGDVKAKATVISICVAMVGLIFLVLWAFWPGTKEDDNIQDMQVEGSGNTIQTEQSKEYSLLHIENLKTEAMRNSWINGGLFLFIFLVMLGYGAHYKIIRVPKRNDRNEEDERKDDKIEEMELELVEAGYLKRKKRKRKMSGKKKKEVKIKKSRRNKRRNDDEEDEDEEEEV
jgi:hypothetical protein